MFTLNKRTLPFVFLALSTITTCAYEGSHSVPRTTESARPPSNAVHRTPPRRNPEGEERIRGNRRSKIYHWPGCPNYDDIAPHNRVPFSTAEEARQAGYRAARNCD